MVFSTTWLEFKDMAQDLLVRREPVSASCNRRPDEGLETTIQPLPQHPANCPLRWRLSNGLGVYLSWLQAGFSHHTRQPKWWSVHQRRLATSCPPFRQPPTSYNLRPVYMDDNARSHRSRAVTAYLQSEAVTSVPWPAISPDLNTIEHIWDMLGRRIHAREPPVQNIRQLEAALHREWQQLSQQDIRRLTGGMRRRIEAVIQARGGYTRYWTLNNRCRQVIHKWRFESEMTILSCFLNCKGQYLKWTCFTAKTGLVMLWLLTFFFIFCGFLQPM